MWRGAAAGVAAERWSGGLLNLGGGRVALVGDAVGVVRIVADAVGELQLGIVELDHDGMVVAVPLVGGGVIAESVVVGAGVDGLLDGVLEAIGVDEGFAAGFVGELEHGAVLAGG